MTVIHDYSATTFGRFVSANLAPGTTAISDGWSGYAKLKEVKHQPKMVGQLSSHVVVPWIHRVFGNAKRWAMGVYRGLRATHLQRYLDALVVRLNRRKTQQAAFASLFDIAMGLNHAPYQILIQRS